MIEVGKDNFANEVLESDRPVLVDIWGPTCEPCLALMPSVEELAKEYGADGGGWSQVASREAPIPLTQRKITTAKVPAGNLAYASLPLAA